jgi:hypothetical protein
MCCSQTQKLLACLLLQQGLVQLLCCFTKGLPQARQQLAYGVYQAL